MGFIISGQPNGVPFEINSLYAYLLRIHDWHKRRGIRYSLVVLSTIG
jgi:hypothetical protein